MPNARGAFALRSWATEARAARPASLASSARTVVLDAVALQASARAARPLASGALPEIFVERACKKSVVFREAGLGKFCGSRSTEALRLGGRAGGYKNSMFGKAELELLQTQALRRSAKPNARGRAATSFARGGGFGLFASGTTQRTMHAGSLVLRPLPNPSIERTNNGGSSLSVFANAQPPLFASHLKR